MNASRRVRILQVVDKLRQILDRVDVVVRRRRDQTDTRRGVPNLGDPRVHLVSRKLAALTGLGSLRHLDLDVGAVGQVVRGDAETSRRDLLDGTASPIAVLVRLEARDVLAALTGVRASTETVHRDGKGLVCLGRDGAVAHRARGETLDDLAGRLDLVDRNSLSLFGLEAEQTAQRREPLGLVVDHLRVFLEDVVLTGAGGVLQLEDGVRVEEVVLPFPTPLVLAARLELTVCAFLTVVEVRDAMSRCDVVGDLVEIDTAEVAVEPGEVLVDQFLRQADDLEQLGSGVRRESRDAHLGHHLQHALACGLDVVADGLVEVDAGEGTALDHVLDRLEGHVRIDRCRTESDEQSHVVDLAGVTGFDDQTDLGAGLLTNEMVVHCRGEEQGRNRSELLTGLSVGEHDDPRPARNGSRNLSADGLQRLSETFTTLGNRVQATHDHRAQLFLRALVVDVDELGEVVVVQDRLGQHDLLAAVGTRVEQIALGTDGAAEAGDDLFTDRVERRVGDLGEQLREVVEQHPRTCRQHGDRGIGTHRTDGLGTGLRHRRDQHVQFLGGVSEDLLADQHAIVRHVHVRPLGQIVDRRQALVEPLLVRVLGGEFVLDLVVGDDAALCGVHQEHPARLQANLADDLGRVDVQHADLGSHDDQAVVGDPQAAGAKTVAVQNGADDGAVGEAHRGRSVPGLHQRGVVLVERPTRGVHGFVPLPGLGNHHQHGMRQAAAAEVQQFEHLVETCCVTGSVGDDGEDLLERFRATEHVGGDEGLAGAHPVLVAGRGVDLTVVCDPSERVGQRPRRERVGRETRMHKSQCTFDALVLQVEVEALELGRGQHALVDERLRGQ
ncbi:unannotated protein [freshwater metagenome]|uniref:Unannotated protein n=1 Tax=freshwater metagenome TaxID=449393 RepID=A0A6J7F8A9_9ZZZZ